MKTVSHTILMNTPLDIPMNKFLPNEVVIRKIAYVYTRNGQISV